MTTQTRILIDFWEFEKVYALWDLVNDRFFDTPREFKSLKAAENFCKRNNLTYKLGLNLDG